MRTTRISVYVYSVLKSAVPNCLQFVGRWLSTVDGTVKEASFPGEPLLEQFLNSIDTSEGVYFDFSVAGSTTVLVSLHNADHLPLKQARDSSSKLSFLPLADSPSAAPISLLARVSHLFRLSLQNFQRAET